MIIFESFRTLYELTNRIINFNDANHKKVLENQNQQILTKSNRILYSSHTKNVILLKTKILRLQNLPVHSSVSHMIF